MPIINERHSIKTDEAINMALPEIDNGLAQILLIYEASEELHKIHIKDEIVKFLIGIKAKKITAYVNTSIYFQMPDTDTVMRDLDNGFRKYFEPFQQAHNGKIFWMFNELRYYKAVKEGGDKRVGMIGKGNSTLKGGFETEVEALRVSLKPKV